VCGHRLKQEVLTHTSRACNAPPYLPAQTASALSAVRGVMAALCFVPFAWAWRKDWPHMPRAFWMAACELALWNFLSQVRTRTASRAQISMSVRIT
jgi:hypothetical protein